MQLSIVVKSTLSNKWLPLWASLKMFYQTVVYYTDQLAQEFSFWDLRKQNVSSTKKTHHVIYLHTNRSLASRGQGKVKYALKVNKNENMTLMIMLGGAFGTQKSIQTTIQESQPCVSNLWTGSRPISKTLKLILKILDRLFLFTCWLTISSVFKHLLNICNYVMWIESCS